MSKVYSTERLLQILESLAEDELFFKNEVEIEQIEKAIRLQEESIKN